MSKDFDNLDDLFKYVEEEIKEVLEEDVADMARDIESQMVEKVVYGSYTSQKPYVDRRGKDDGLMDKRNMYAKMYKEDDSQVMELLNLTDGNPDASYTTFTEPPFYLAGIIEYGRTPKNKGLYTRNKTRTQYEYLQPRPFISTSIDHIENLSLHYKSMKNGLKKKGFDME